MKTVLLITDCAFALSLASHVVADSGYPLVHFVPQNGAAVISITQEVDAVYSIPSPEPDLDGYTFVGWFTEPGGAGEEISGTFVPSQVPLHIYGYWLNSNGEFRWEKVK